MRKFLTNPWVIVGGLLVAAVAFYLFRPDTLFLDDRADESLEDAFAASEPVSADASEPMDEEPMDEESMDEDPMDEEPMDEEAPATTTTTVPAGPVAETSGSFEGIGRYSASGTATVYEQAGERILRFEDDTDIQNGPDLYVWLVPTAEYDGGEPTEFIDLGRLTGNVGGQNYDLPDGFDPEGDWTVVIWCLRFTVPFASAPLA
ncbi:MAG: DM13 domain-containing protein [Acidimicrobiia bacterium]